MPFQQAARVPSPPIWPAKAHQKQFLKWKMMHNFAISWSILELLVPTESWGTLLSNGAMSSWWHLNWAIIGQQMSKILLRMFKFCSKFVEIIQNVCSKWSLLYFIELYTRGKKYEDVTISQPNCHCQLNIVIVKNWKIFLKKLKFWKSLSVFFDGFAQEY